MINGPWSCRETYILPSKLAGLKTDSLFLPMEQVLYQPDFFSNLLLTPLCLGWSTCRAEGTVWSLCPLLSASVLAGLAGREQ